MEFTLLEILYAALIFFTIIVGSLLSIILWKLLKIVSTIEEITHLYNQVKEIISLYKQIPEFIVELVKQKLFWWK